MFHKQCRPRYLVTFTIVVCTENDLLASVYKGEEKKKSCSVFSPLRLRSFRAKLRCLRLACRSYEQPNRASDHMVVMALLESVCAATERPWYALCADPISGLGSENFKSVEGSKSMDGAMHFLLVYTDAQQVILSANDNTKRERKRKRREKGNQQFRGRVCAWVSPPCGKKASIMVRRNLICSLCNCIPSVPIRQVWQAFFLVLCCCQMKKCALRLIETNFASIAMAETCCVVSYT
jgi:hypothetical protein